MNTEKLISRMLLLIEGDITAAEEGEDGINTATSKKITDYIKTIIAMQKDAREQLKVGEWESMTDEETQAKLEEALATLRGEET